jgi:RimJ/RimL family protein N-acetyltransferase
MATSAIPDIDTSVYDFYLKGLPVTIETKDLILRSFKESDLKFLQALYTDPDTMKLYTDNEKRLETTPFEQWKEENMKAAAGRIATFMKRLNEKNPFNGFVICKKSEDNRPIGFIVPGLGDKPGQLETAFVITKEEQCKGFGTQAVDAIVRKYLPALITNHYKIYGQPLLAEGAPVYEMVATARLDNAASIRVMEKAGMKKTGENPNKWGQIRAIYSYTYENFPLEPQKV